MTAPAATRRYSYSKLSQFESCSWAYRLTRILKLPETPSVWLPAGSAFHTTTEAFDRADQEIGEFPKVIEQFDLEYWQNLFQIEFDINLDKLRQNEPDESKWKVAGRGRESVAFWREAGPRMVAGYIEWRLNSANALRIASLNGVAGIEIELVSKFGDVEVVAFADRVVEDTRTGVLAVTDLKTGSRMPTDPKQIGQYSLQLEEIFGVPVSWGAYYNARAGFLQEPVDLTGYTRELFTEKYTELDRKVTAGEFEPTITNLCKTCGVRKWCVYQGGSEPEESE